MRFSALFFPFLNQSLNLDILAPDVFSSCYRQSGFEDKRMHNVSTFKSVSELIADDTVERVLRRAEESCTLPASEIQNARIALSELKEAARQQQQHLQHIRDAAEHASRCGVASKRGRVA
ncbi:hypothetical protein [Magnetofaba australis]|uniref:Uncharacterized protein n=1 Tax=Magnetofaba australis IT-1 TaxID=1434232 RepID=A0A1Y2JZW5_9PROT|nr:hypothetical protein [Magnetofaba australis]OSM00457.1 hypothetical protein MAIT1_00979 [Magnetofaba australis IT-1]